ncbi:hypothetical protein Psta_2777 [Pirellula staleyi DSM 6068]|uniref:Uncharacterized protein n=1 Tax=Pirellula staleyi (strain ATCC 27377 / DSM 6068 / ICPB 4128) TaxID=530564 RepID=D2R7L7_PIRSD|nr:hypothetical protein [Pirellula staleyi]ADB17443.1 hypothetical protein Psta_2777 [Pirellula staleyi DSM 6068]
MEITDADLEAYLEELLPPAEMTAIELRIRDDATVLERLAAINGRRDAGLHSVGEIWRRMRLSCPSREQLGSYLLGVLDDGHLAFIKQHVEVVGCRLCVANVEDLHRQQQESGEAVRTRRSKYFQSTAAHLRGKQS